MKILYVTTVNATINRFLVPHIKMLIHMGHEVHCACFLNREIHEDLIKLGVKTFNLPFKRSPLSTSNLKAFKNLIELQKKNNYEVVHVHTPVGSIYGRGLKLRFPKIKTMYTAHGYHFFRGGEKKAWLLYYPIEKLMAKLTDATININKEDYEITKNRLKPKKTYLVNGVGVELSHYKILNNNIKELKRAELKVKEDEFLIIMIGELNKNKNQVQLIKAMEILNQKYKNIKAIVVGQGNKLEELKEDVERRGLHSNISFLGYRLDVNELINASDIGALLSYREGLPRSLMELMVNEKPIVATNIRGCRDMISAYEKGYLVAVNNYEETAKSIESLYLEWVNKEEFRKKENNIETVAKEHKELGKNNFNNIEKYYLDNVLKELQEIYKEVLA